MNRRTCAMISLGANLALIALVGLLQLARHSADLPAFTAARSATGARAVSAPMTLRPQGGETAVVNEPFAWNQLASPDFRVYAENLRAVGCPERTVRDIILCEVNAFFRRRVRELVEPAQSRFWELVTDKEAFEQTVNEKHEQLQALAHEREALLESVLGEPFESLSSRDRHLEQAIAGEEFLDFLPASTRERVLAVQRKYDQLRSSMPSSLAETDRREWMEKQNNDLMREVAGLLSPQELEEYRLRESRYASARFSLLGLEVTEEEARALARLQQKFSTENSPNPGPRTPEAKAQFDEAARALLGEERYAEYERTQDSRYPELFQVMERLGLGAKTAADALEIQRAGEEAANVVRSEPSLDPQKKTETLQLIKAETQQAMAQLMGETNYGIYRKKFGGWMSSLGKLQ